VGWGLSVDLAEQSGQRTNLTGRGKAYHYSITSLNISSYVYIALRGGIWHDICTHIRVWPRRRKDTKKNQIRIDSRFRENDNTKKRFFALLPALNYGLFSTGRAE